MKLHLYRRICGVILVAGCLALSLSACKGREQVAEAGKTQAEETAAAEEAKTEVTEGNTGAEEVQAETETSESAASAGSAADVSPPEIPSGEKPPMGPPTGQLPENLPELPEGTEPPAFPGGNMPARPGEGAEMPNKEQMPGRGVPEAAINPAGNVRVLVTFKDGVSVEDGLTAIAKEILNGETPVVHRRDDAAGEVSITVTLEQMEALPNCSVVATAKAQLQVPMQ